MFVDLTGVSLKPDEIYAVITSVKEIEEQPEQSAK